MLRILKKMGANKALRLKKCKPFILGFCFVFAFVMLLGSTLAWFTTAQNVKNEIKTPPDGMFSVNIVDNFPQPDKPKPGDQFPKAVGADNIGDKGAFVRLLVMAVFVKEDGVTLLPATVGGPDSDSMVILKDLNTTDWYYGDDSYYYYRHILPPHTTTDVGGLNKNLFNLVELDSQRVFTDEYKSAKLKIEVKIEAVGTTKWDYRKGWWGIDTTPATPLDVIDGELAALAK